MIKYIIIFLVFIFHTACALPGLETLRKPKLFQVKHKEFYAGDIIDVYLGVKTIVGLSGVSVKIKTASGVSVFQPLRYGAYPESPHWILNNLKAFDEQKLWTRLHLQKIQSKFPLKFVKISFTYVVPKSEWMQFIIDHPKQYSTENFEVSSKTNLESIKQLPHTYTETHHIILDLRRFNPKQP